jgi:hypothetical protein
LRPLEERLTVFRCTGLARGSEMRRQDGGSTFLLLRTWLIFAAVGLIAWAVVMVAGLVEN